MILYDMMILYDITMTLGWYLNNSIWYCRNCYYSAVSQWTSRGQFYNCIDHKISVGLRWKTNYNENICLQTSPDVHGYLCMTGEKNGRGRGPLTVWDDSYVFLIVSVTLDFSEQYSLSQEATMQSFANPSWKNIGHIKNYVQQWDLANHLFLGVYYNQPIYLILS